MTSISNHVLSDIDELKLEIIHLTSSCLIREPRMSPIKDEEGLDTDAGHVKKKDETAVLMERIRYLVHAISHQDGEYVPKLTLYLRHELNLRTISNFLMALCAREPNCLPTYVCYLEKLLVLPSDWLAVANFSYFYDNDDLHSEAYFTAIQREAEKTARSDSDNSSAAVVDTQTGFIRTGEGSDGGAMPHARKNKNKNKSPPPPPPPPPPPQRRIPNGLRQALKKTFCQFDEFALAKYNNEKSLKRHRARDKLSEEESHAFSFKVLIRLLHLSTPVYSVCCILGKRYPSTLEEFQRMGLDEGGRQFDQRRSGERMSLEQPLTWERALSARGNTAEVWEDLFLKNAVPFMATLRNLRNIVLRCCSEVTHQKIVDRLGSEEQVAQSKQFPYRFYSAREALLDLDELVAKEARIQANRTKNTGTKKARIAAPVLHLKGKKRTRKAAALPSAWTEELDRRRRELLQSLDKAVSISTKLNIPPMKGTSLVILSLFPGLRKPMGGGGGGGNRKASKANLSKRTQLDAVALLVSMMFRACEKCVVVLFCLNEFVVYNPAPPPCATECGGEPMEPSVLDRTNDLVQECKSLLARVCEQHPEWAEDTQTHRHHLGRFPFALLDQLVTERQPIESFVVLDEGHHTYSCMNADAPSFGDLPVYLERLRRVSSPHLVFVGINVGGRRPSGDRPGESSEAYLQSRFHHRNDFLLSGFSDAILKLIAERTGGGPQAIVERADVTYHVQKSSARLTNDALEQKRKVLSLLQRLEETYALPEHKKRNKRGKPGESSNNDSRHPMSPSSSPAGAEEQEEEPLSSLKRFSRMDSHPSVKSSSAGLSSSSKPLSRGPAEAFYALQLNNGRSLALAEGELPVLPSFEDLIVQPVKALSGSTPLSLSDSASGGNTGNRIGTSESASVATRALKSNSLKGEVAARIAVASPSSSGEDGGGGTFPLVIPLYRLHGTGAAGARGGGSAEEQLAEERIERRFLSSYRLWRFFISSTFLDMNSERNALTLDVFPRLRRWIADRGLKIHLLEVDLRWGITMEATTKNLSTSVCLNEVARCSPFFIGLLGSRYGYVPHPLRVVPDDDVSLEDFEWLRDESLYADCSVTDLEVKQAVHSARLRLNSSDFPSSMLFFVRDEKYLSKSLTSAVARRVYAPDTPTATERIRALEKYLEQEGMNVARYKCAVKAEALDSGPAAAAVGAGLSGMLGDDSGVDLPPLTDETDVGALLDHSPSALHNGALTSTSRTSVTPSTSAAAAAPTSKDVPLDMTDFSRRVFTALRRAILKACEVGDHPGAPVLPEPHPHPSSVADTTPFGSRSGSPHAAYHDSGPHLLQEIDSGSFSSQGQHHPNHHTAPYQLTPGRPGRPGHGDEGEGSEGGDPAAPHHTMPSSHPHQRRVAAVGNTTNMGGGRGGVSGRTRQLSSDYYASLYMDNMTFMEALSNIYVPPHGLVQQLATFACSMCVPSPSAPSAHHAEKNATATHHDFLTTQTAGLAFHSKKVDGGSEGALSTLDAHALLVTAQDGNGKSSALAALGRYLMQWSTSQVVVYYSFQGVGVSALRAMLFYMATTLVLRADLHGAIFIDEGTEMEGLLDVFSRIGTELTKKQRSVVVILDAVDYCEDANEFCRCFQYMYSAFGGQYNRFVVSATLYSRVSQALLQRFSFCKELVIPVLTESERADVVRRHLATYGKRLQETWDVNELQGILRKQESGKVSYLTMALMHLRLFSTFDTLRSDIKRLPGTILTLFPLFFKELECRFDHDTCFAVFTSLYLRHAMGGIMEYNLYRLMDNVAAATRLVALLSGTCLVSREGRVSIRTTVFYNAIRETYFRQASSFVRTSEQMLVAELLGEPITTRRDEMRIKNVIRTVTASLERMTRVTDAPPSVFQPRRCSPQELLGILHTSVQAEQHDLTLVLISYFPFLEALLLDTVVFHRFLNFLSQLRSGSVGASGTTTSQTTGSGGAAPSGSGSSVATSVVAGNSVVVKVVHPIMDFLLQHYHILSIRPDLLLQCLRNMPPSFTAIKEVKGSAGGGGGAGTAKGFVSAGGASAGAWTDGGAVPPHSHNHNHSHTPPYAAAAAAASTVMVGLGSPLPPSLTVPPPSAGLLPPMITTTTTTTTMMTVGMGSDGGNASESASLRVITSGRRDFDSPLSAGSKSIADGRVAGPSTWVRWANQQQHGGEARQAMLSPSSQPVRLLTGSASRSLVAYSCEELVVRVCASNDLRQTAMATLTHACEVTAVAFVMGGKPGSASGRRGDEDTLISATVDGKLWLWDLESGTLRFVGHLHTRAVTALAAHPKDTVVVSASLDTYCVVWDCCKLQGGRSKLRQHLDEILERNDPKHRAAAFRTKGLRNTSAGEAKLRPLVPLLCLRDHSYPVSSAAFHKAGSVLATGAWNGGVVFYDFARLSETITERGSLADCVWRQRMRVGSPVRVLSFIPSMILTCAVGRFDGRISLLDYASLAEGGCVTGLHHAPVSSLGFSADGKLMATADISGVVRVSYSGLMGTLLATFNGHRDHVTATLFIGASATGSSFSTERLVTSSMDQTIQVWGVNSEEKPALTAAHSAAVTALTCTNDGKTFVTGSEDGLAYIFTLDEDVGEYYKRCQLEGSGKSSSTLASGGTAGLSVYASTSTSTTTAGGGTDYRQPAFVLSHDGKAVTVIRFALEDTRLLTGVSSGEVYVWSSEPGLDRRSGRLLYRLAAPARGSYPIISLDCVEDFRCGSDDTTGDANDHTDDHNARDYTVDDPDRLTHPRGTGGRTARVVALCANGEAVSFDLYSTDVSLALLGGHDDRGEDDIGANRKERGSTNAAATAAGEEMEVKQEESVLEAVYRVCRQRLRWLRPVREKSWTAGENLTSWRQGNDYHQDDDPQGEKSDAGTNPLHLEAPRKNKDGWVESLHESEGEGEDDSSEAGRRRLRGGGAKIDSEQMKAYLFGEELIGVMPLRMEGRLRRRRGPQHRDSGEGLDSSLPYSHRKGRIGENHLQVDISSHLSLLVGRTKLFLASVLTGCIAEIFITNVNNAMGAVPPGMAKTEAVVPAVSILQMHKEEIFTKVSRAVPTSEPITRSCGLSPCTGPQAADDRPRDSLCFAVATSECRVFLFTAHLPSAPDGMALPQSPSEREEVSPHDDGEPQDDDEWEHQFLYADQIQVVAERLPLDAPTTHKAPSHRRVVALDLAWIPAADATLEKENGKEEEDNENFALTSGNHNSNNCSASRVEGCRRHFNNGTLGLLLGCADGASHLFSISPTETSLRGATRMDSSSPLPLPLHSPHAHAPVHVAPSSLVTRELGTFFAASTLTACVLLPPFGKGAPLSYHQRRAQAILRSMGLLADKALRQRLSSPLLHWVTGDSLGNIYQLRLVRDESLSGEEEGNAIASSRYGLSRRTRTTTGPPASSPGRSAVATPCPFWASTDWVSKPLPSLEAMRAFGVGEAAVQMEGRVRTADGFFSSPPPLTESVEAALKRGGMPAVLKADDFTASKRCRGLGGGLGPLSGWEALLGAAPTERLVGVVGHPSSHPCFTLGNGDAMGHEYGRMGIEVPAGLAGGGDGHGAPPPLPALPPGLSTLLGASGGPTITNSHMTQESKGVKERSVNSHSSNALLPPPPPPPPPVVASTSPPTPQRRPQPETGDLHDPQIQRSHLYSSSSPSYFAIIHDPPPSSLRDHEVVAYLTRQQEVLREALRVQHYNEEAKEALRLHSKLSEAATLAHLQHM